MNAVTWLFKWILKVAIFFTLFAFALNNQGDVTLHFFFGQQWTAPMVLVVLGAFAAGLVVGILGMVPRWWRQRHKARVHAATPAQSPAAPSAPSPGSGFSDSSLHGV